MAYHVIDPFCLELLLSGTDHADLGDRVDAGEQEPGKRGLPPLGKGMAHGHAGLFHAGGRKRRKTDDVASRVDMRDACLIMGIDGQTALGADLEPCRREVQCGCVAAVSCRVLLGRVPVLAEAPPTERSYRGVVSWPRG
jgi:hypothetical protein